jgi:general secretion pathway protein H
MRTSTAATSKGSEVRGQGAGMRGIVFLVWPCWFFSLPTPDPRPPTPSTGFTLIELSLVLFIIGLLMVVLVPQFGSLESARLESSARRLAALARYLSAEAALKGRVYRLNYDLDQGIYSVMVLAASQDAAEFIPDSSPFSRPVQLLPPIAFADVRLPSTGRVNTGQVATHFYPQGYADPAVIHLRNKQARVVTIIVPPLTGEVGVYEGYVDGFHNR